MIGCGENQPTAYHKRQSAVRRVSPPLGTGTQCVALFSIVCYQDLCEKVKINADSSYEEMLIMTVQDAADYFRVHLSTNYRLLRRK